MPTTKTADNMASAVARLIDDRRPLRLSEIDPFLAATAQRPWSDADDSWPDAPHAADAGAAPAVAARAEAPKPGRNGKGRGRKRAKAVALTAGGRRMRLIAAPLLLALAVALVVPAVWSVLIFAGVKAPMSDHDSARKMAAMMLVCWPLAAFLSLAAGWMIKDLLAAQQR